METGYIVIIILLALNVAALLIYLHFLRSELREIARELDDRLRTDTNTLVSVSAGDRAMRSLAAEINRQLHSLRKERLKLKHGDMELKNAVTNISHDLRTPLTAICGYLELLEREPLSDRSARYIAVIRERTDAMRGLTEELFHYSVISESEEDEPEPVCLNSLLEQSLAGFYGVLSERGIAPDIVMPDTPVRRVLDPKAVRRIFDNILSNAAKYSDGDLSVRLEKDGRVTFENGAGELDPVQTAHLFDRFYTVNTARGGTGIGLSVARLLTERLGGSLGAEYREGRLSIFVCFPEETGA